MTHYTDTRYSRCSTRTRSALGRTLAFAFALGVLTTSSLAGADDGVAAKAESAQPADVTTGEQAAPTFLEFSPYELAYLLRDRMTSYQVAPKATVEESAVRSAWRNALKARSGRMMKRMERVMDSKRWNVRPAAMDAWAPTTKSTASVLRELARLYVEVSASKRSIAKARIVNQEPLYFGTLPSRLKRRPTMEAEIKGTRLDTARSEEMGAFGILGGGPVGIYMKMSGSKKQSTRRVKVKIYDREVEERMRLAKEARVDGQVALIRARIDAYTESLTKDLELIRVLTASLQLAEEMRLSDRTAQITDADEREAALGLLDMMKISRIDARRRMFNRPSHYGSALSRGWLQKRTKLMRLLAAQAPRG